MAQAEAFGTSYAEVLAEAGLISQTEIESDAVPRSHIRRTLLVDQLLSSKLRSIKRGFWEQHDFCYRRYFRCFLGITAQAQNITDKKTSAVHSTTQATPFNLSLTNL